MKIAEPQYITDNRGKKLSVILSVKDYEKLIEDLEELEDIRLYDEVKGKNEKTVPFEQYLGRRSKRENA